MQLMFLVISVIITAAAAGIKTIDPEGVQAWVKGHQKEQQKQQVQQHEQHETLLFPKPKELILENSNSDRLQQQEQITKQLLIEQHQQQKTFQRSEQENPEINKAILLPALEKNDQQEWQQRHQYKPKVVLTVIKNLPRQEIRPEENRIALNTPDQQQQQQQQQQWQMSEISEPLPKSQVVSFAKGRRHFDQQEQLQQKLQSELQQHEQQTQQIQQKLQTEPEILLPTQKTVKSFKKGGHHNLNQHIQQEQHLQQKQWQQREKIEQANHQETGSFWEQGQQETQPELANIRPVPDQQKHQNQWQRQEQQEPLSSTKGGVKSGYVIAPPERQLQKTKPDQWPTLQQEVTDQQQQLKPQSFSKGGIKSGQPHPERRL